ncbi:Cthe_2314 family HEPN domain-containing protein [Paenibacillus sp. CMAA1364]
MLKTLFGDISVENSNPLVNTAYLTLDKSVQLLQSEITRYEDPTHNLRKIEMWTRGLISSLTELEQSYSVAAYFRTFIQPGFMDEMTEEEQISYARYVYFYKNGFIRIFAILDKLGTVLNEIYDLRTSKVKSQYSYFTVLRQFTSQHKHSALGVVLSTIKEEYREPLRSLRKRRNSEIHYMNMEMQDDLWQRHHGLHDRLVLEDVDMHLLELSQGLDMVCRTLTTVFEYTNKQWLNKSIRTKERYR